LFIHKVQGIGAWGFYILNEKWGGKMIKTLGLNMIFDIMFESDISFRYVVENPKLPRSTHVPEKYLGKNGDGSVRTQEEFRAYASEIRHWEGRIWEYHQFEQKKKAAQAHRLEVSGNQNIPRASRLQLIRMVAARRSSKPEFRKMGETILFKMRRLALIKERAALRFATA
jgi:hypothetical protein